MAMTTQTRDAQDAARYRFLRDLLNIEMGATLAETVRPFLTLRDQALPIDFPVANPVRVLLRTESPASTDAYVHAQRAWLAQLDAAVDAVQARYDDVTLTGGERGMISARPNISTRCD
jgi:hypothetical protein